MSWQEYLAAWGMATLILAFGFITAFGIVKLMEWAT